MKPQDGFERHGIILRPREKHGWQFCRNGWHDAERTTIDHRGEARTRRGVLLKQGATGDHGPSREAHEADLVGREAPFRCTLTNHFESLNSVRNAILAK